MTAVDPRPAADRRTLTTPPRPARGGDRRARVQAYVALTKPRIIELLLVTAVPTMVLAARGIPNLWTVLVVVVGGALAAGSANALNCWFDRDIDQLMNRTANRPLPRHTVTPNAALVFGLGIGVLSVALMAAATNLLAAGLTLGAIVYYAVVYTMWLKRHTKHNTVLGGVCGAAPVLIGWAAVTGSLAPAPWLLFLLMFWWQPPHFWALALKFKADYARAGVPMLPVVASERRVAAECMVYASLTVATSLVVWPVADLGWIYGAVAIGAGAYFVYEAWLLLTQARAGARIKAMRLFHGSITYLTVVFVAVALDPLLLG